MLFLSTVFICPDCRYRVVKRSGEARAIFNKRVRNHIGMHANVTPVEPVARVMCSGDGCTRAINMTVRDMRSAVPPAVEGWRYRRTGGKLFAFCSDCSYIHLGPELQWQSTS